MKRVLCLLLVLAAVCAAAPAAHGETLSAAEEQSLYEALPEETRQRLEQIGVTDPYGTDWDLSPDTAGELLLTTLRQVSTGPLAALGILMVIVLLCALTEGLRETVTEPALSGVYQAVSTVGIGAVLMTPLADSLGRVTAATEGVTVFMGSFVPVYAGVMASSGSVTAALSYQTWMIAAAEGITLLITRLIVPLTAVSLALGLSGSLGKGMKLGAAGGWLNRACAWTLGTAGSLFVGLLSLQQVVTGSADGVAARAVKLSLSSFVPVVGGSLSEALATVQGSLLLLRSTVGVFGIAAVLILLLPPLCTCLVWAVGLSLCRTAAELLDLSGLTEVLRAVGGAVKVLIGALAACGMVMIVSTALVIAVGKGG